MTLFVSATLLFVVQPLFARLVLPLLGGSPAVWNTCMVFYQAALLAGYAYAHASSALLQPRRQIPLHLLILLLPLLLLPLGLPAGWQPPAEHNPVWWLLALLTVAVGLPFVVVSASAPLLQRWFANSGHPDAVDPYFLYAASNAGSLLALIMYPLLLEPYLTQVDQSQLWSMGYVLLLLLLGSCAVLLWTYPDRTKQLNPSSHESEHRQPSAVPPGTKSRWLILAMAPAALLPAVTTHITTDIASIPLLWVLPLGLYLLSFVIAFSRVNNLLRPWLLRLTPLAVLVLVTLQVLRRRPPLLVEIELHLTVFFLLALVCHGELARLRPGPLHLTEYYLWLSLGGVLGGMLVALVAPLVFRTTVEYPLALVAACLLLPTLKPTAVNRLDFLYPLSVGMLTASLAWALQISGLDLNTVGQDSEDLLAWMLWLWAMGLPVGICFAFAARPIRFGLSIGAVLLVALTCAEWRDHIEYRERSFFGQLSVGQIRVQTDTLDTYRCLMHGTTVHGWQSLDPARRDEPLAYFHRTGPVGQLFAARRRSQSTHAVAVTGLGIGSMASYALPGEYWTFYEIDPGVATIANNPAYFTYLNDCRQRGVDLDILLGDARLQLQTAPDEGYDLLFLDAFSSDALPVHLLTWEALQRYRQKLKPDGWLVYNISNRYLDLEGVLANQAEKAGLTGLIQFDEDVQGSDRRGKTPSRFVVLAGPQARLDLSDDPRWRPLRPRPEIGLWTDDFSNLLSIIRWR